MKNRLLVRITLFAYLILIGVANAQTVSTDNQVLDGTSFGNEILVPIYSQDITSSYGNIIIATIRVEYNEEVLEFVEYTNLNEALPTEDLNISVNPSGVDGVVQLNIEHIPFSGFAWPNGKMFDLKFVFSGGDAGFNIISGSTGFLPVDFIEKFPTITQGSIVGYEDIIASDGAWNIPGTWSGDLGILTQPGPGHNVTINSGGTVTIPADAVANSVSIADGGQLTLDAVATLDVTGAFTIQSGGSFIQNGTLNAASKTAERAIAAANWADPLDGWHLISSSVASQAISGDWTPSGEGNDYDFYAWSEPDNEWKNQKVSGNGITTFNVGQGYNVSYQQSGSKSFTGDFNTADVTANLTNSSSGFNLLGNPYPSALIWGTGWTLGDVQATAYAWNRASKSYTDISTGDPIPAHNGFMVYTQAAQNLTIPAAARDHNAQAWYKSTEMGVKLVAVETSTGASQINKFKFNADATLGYDLAYDAYYLEGYAPQLYSMAGESKLMVNTQAVLDLGKTYDLYFEKMADATAYSLQLLESTINEPVYLTDLKHNTTVLLSGEDGYAFEAEDGDDPLRFQLHFSPLGIDEAALAATSVRSMHNQILIDHLSAETLQVKVYNLTGQLVHTTEINGASSTTLNERFNSGVYLIQLAGDNASKTVKIVIH